MKRYIIIGAFLLFCLHVIAQSIDSYKEGVSPQVALINQYGSYPVDYSTGLVDISIPLYTIQAADFTIPLQLKFHPSGLRSEEPEGLLGLRWALFGGGHISRIVKGYPDGNSSLPFNKKVNDPFYTPDFNTLWGTLNTHHLTGEGSPSIDNREQEYKDTQYDIFSYALPSGKSGKFILHEVSGKSEAFTMPYEPIKVKGQSVIIDENGVTYRFGEERLSAYGAHDYRCVDYDSYNKCVASWHLTSIISANKQDTILIDYIKQSYYEYKWNDDLVILSNLHANTAFIKNTLPHRPGEHPVISPLYTMIGDLLTNPNEYVKRPINYSIGHYEPLCISAIKHKRNGKLICSAVFYYENSSSTSYGPKYLSEMIVSDGEDNVLQEIFFHMKGKSGPKSFMLLDKIEFTQGVDYNKVYSFSYHDEERMPSREEILKNSDWWGYYSLGAGDYYATEFPVKLPEPVPDGIGDFVEVYKLIKVSGGHKRASGTSIGMLKEICYPTGGKTQFWYEGNETNFGYCGGLRIKKVNNILENGKIESKWYTYGSNVFPEYLHPPINNKFQNIYIFKKK